MVSAGSVLAQTRARRRCHNTRVAMTTMRRKAEPILVSVHSAVNGK